MSMLLMVQAFKIKVGCSSRKLILLKLADNANDQGYCWPSYQYIADLCEMSKRSAIRHIKKLEEQGFLHIDHRPGVKGNSSNMYCLTLDKSRGDNLTPPSDRVSPPPSDNLSPGISHSFESVIEPKDLVENEFDRLWQAWPNSKNKKKSLPAFAKIAKHTPRPDIFVNNLIGDIQARIQSNQLGFTEMMLTTYLNGERWKDGITNSQTRKDPLLEAMGLI